MPILRDKVLVVDLEATCWENNQRPPDQTQEIIEIGACFLDIQTFQPESRFNVLVKPTQSEINPFCTGLTSITPEMVEAEGTDFASACQQLEQAFRSSQRLWASWGRFDKRLFKAQCKARNVSYPFSPLHANLKKLYANEFNSRRPIGLARALEANGVQPEGTAHRAGDDAWNTARLLGIMLEKQGERLLRKHW